MRTLPALPLRLPPHPPAHLLRRAEEEGGASLRVSCDVFAFLVAICLVGKLCVNLRRHVRFEAVERAKRIRSLLWLAHLFRIFGPVMVRAENGALVCVSVDDP